MESRGAENSPPAIGRRTGKLTTFNLNEIRNPNRGDIGSQSPSIDAVEGRKAIQMKNIMTNSVIKFPRELDQASRSSMMLGSSQLMQESRESFSIFQS